MTDLNNVAEKLVKEGPYKTESTPRRIRGLLGGVYVFDTTKAVYVWEHGYYPYFYIPRSGIKDGVLSVLEKGNGHGFSRAELDAGGKETDRVILFNDDAPAGLRDLVRIEVSALDAWFAEDEKLLGTHPKDPYKRIETLPSSREVRFEFDEVVLAKGSQNVFLYETGLRPRYYLAPTSVNWEVLRESKTETYCPYKGMANYYDVVVNGREIKDAVWYYRYPTSESALIAGRLCFYNEKVDVFVDGVKEVK